MAEERLRKIIKTTYDTLFSLIFRLCADRGLTEDILQECYIKIWKNFDAITDDDSILSLLKIYVRNALIDEFRKRIKMRVLFPEQLPENYTQVSDEQNFYEDRQIAIEKILMRLPESQRAVFILRWRHAMSHTEIASALNIAQGTVETHMNRALKSLRKQLGHLQYIDLIILLICSSDKIFYTAWDFSGHMSLLTSRFLSCQ